MTGTLQHCECFRITKASVANSLAIRGRASSLGHHTEVNSQPPRVQTSEATCMPRLPVFIHLVCVISVLAASTPAGPMTLRELSRGSRRGVAQSHALTTFVQPPSLCRLAIMPDMMGDWPPCL